MPNDTQNTQDQNSTPSSVIPPTPVPDGPKSEMPLNPLVSDLPPVITPPPLHKEGGTKTQGKKIVATIFGILILVGGVGAGVFLTKQNQDIRERADIQEVCSQESSGGCANLPWGTSCGSGSLTCHPQNPAQVGSDQRQICQCTQQTTGSNIILSCDGIKTYLATNVSDATSWQEITGSDYSKLRPGQDIYITVTGGVTENEVDKATIDKARFAVSFTADTSGNLTWSESTNKKPNSEEYYFKYTIPQDKSDFYFNAQLHDSSTDRWF